MAAREAFVREDSGAGSFEGQLVSSFLVRKRCVRECVCVYTVSIVIELYVAGDTPVFIMYHVDFPGAHPVKPLKSVKINPGL